MNIGDKVRVIAEKGEWSGAPNPFLGKVGTLEQINEHSEDGDFYGVRFEGQRSLFFFFADELTVIEKGGVSTGK